MEIPGGRGEQPEALWNGKSGGVGAQTVNNPPWGGVWIFSGNTHCTNFHFSIHSRHYLKWITSTLFSKSSYLASGLFWINSMTIWKKETVLLNYFVYTYEYVLQEWRTNWGDYLFLWYLTHSNFFSHEVHKWHVLLWCLHQYILCKSCHQIIRYFLVLTEDLAVILHPWNENK